MFINKKAEMLFLCSSLEKYFTEYSLIVSFLFHHHKMEVQVYIGKD